jgi:carbon monoxide dehydrogenase subunit G
VLFAEAVNAPVSLDVAWDFIWQVDQLARCLPGCTGVEEVEAGARYRAFLEDQVGPYRVHILLDVTVVESAPPHYTRLLAVGKDDVVGVSQRIDLRVRLDEIGPHQTALHLDADVLVEGAIARLGGFLIKRKAADIVKQLARNVDAALRAIAHGRLPPHG